MTGIILAGGKALRMGGLDKAFLTIDDEHIINIQLNTLKKIFDEIIIVTNSAEKYKCLKGVKVISDVILGQGPLGGIYSGLLASRSFRNFVVACDMPFLNKSLIRYMIKDADDHDVILPKIGRRFHPLFGVYSKNCIPVIEGLIKKGELRISSVFPRVKCRFLLRAELEKFDERHLTLSNINTAKDYRKAYLAYTYADKVCVN